MGAYVWFQSKDGDPEVVANTTPGLAAAPTTLPGSRPEALPSSKYAPIVLPGSKRALVFQPGEVAVLPGSKSDDISLLKILPGSKSGKVAIPAEFLKTDEEAAKNLTILPGSKSLAKVTEVDPAKVAAALRKAREAESEAMKLATEKPKKPTFLPGSKSSTLLDPTQLQPQAGKEARLRKELEARQRQKAKGPTEK